MIIKRNKASITTIPIDGVNVTLFPGLNTIEGDVAEKLRDHKDFQAQEKAGYMEIVESKKAETAAGGSAGSDDELTDDITQMGAGDAVEIVKGTLYVKHLEKMLEDETANKNRKSVKKAIEGQMDELRKEDGEDDGQGDE